jgi:hypothetical protein
MTSKHQKTLELIYENPVRSDVSWSDIESLLLYIGAEISEGRGSRVRIALHGIRAVFHRPHPKRETDKRFKVHAPISHGSRSKTTIEYRGYTAG